mgnify:FL=1
MRIIRILSLLFLSALALQAQQPESYSSYYDLFFLKTFGKGQGKGWISDSRDPENVHLASRRRVREDYNHYLTVKYTKHSAIQGRFRIGLIQQLIPLPHAPKKEILIAVRLIPLYLDSVSLIAHRLNAREELLGRDTISIPSSELAAHNGSIYDLRLPLSDHQTELLQLTLIAATRKPILDSTMVSLVDSRIWLDGQDISHLPLRTYPTPSFSLSRAQSIDPSTGKGLSSIDLLRKKRIIGLGETTYGHIGFQLLQQEVAKYLIEQRSCRLILTEQSLEHSLRWNRYIQDPSYTIDTTSIPPLQLAQLKYLRTINAQRTDKVFYLGMDYIHDYGAVFSTPKAIIDFVTSLSSWGKSRALDQLVLALQDSSARQVVNYIDREQQALLPDLSADELAIIRHILLISEFAGVHRRVRIDIRDLVMAENARLLIDLLSPDPKHAVLITANLGHLSLASTLPMKIFPSLGSRLRAIYGRDFTTIAMLSPVGERLFQDMYTKSRIISSVAEPPTTSIEAHVQRLPAPACFYMPIPKELDRLYLLRSYGSAENGLSFTPQNLFRRAEGMIVLNTIPQHGFQTKEVKLSGDEVKALAHSLLQRHTQLIEATRKRLQDHHNQPEP